MLSKIIIGQEPVSKSEYIEKLLAEIGLKQNSPDVLSFEADEKIGVEETKKAREFLSIKPIGGGYKCVVFWSIEQISHIGQNALLKTIEDIGENGVVLMSGSSTERVLPTLLSRMELVTLSNQTVEADLAEAREWLTLPLEEKFKVIEKLDDKLAFFEGIAMVAREKLVVEKWTRFGEKVLEAESFWKANGNQRAILEWLALELEGDDRKD